MFELSSFKFIIFGLPEIVPSGLLLTWLLFLGTVSVSILSSYVLACLAARSTTFHWLSSTVFTILRGIPPLILILGVDHFFPITSFHKGVLALSLYSVSNLFPIHLKYIQIYPDELKDVEKVLKIGVVQRYSNLLANWVFSRSFQAMQTHLVSLFKDTSIVLIIGLLEVSALTKLLSSRTYDISSWVGIFLFCAAVYFVNVQLLNAFFNWVNRSLFLKY